MELTPYLGQELPSQAGRALFLGIKGVGMLAAALLLQDQGWEILGQDVEEIFHTDELIKQRGITVQNFGSHLPQPLPDLIVRTGAHHDKTRSMLEEARGAGATIMSLAQLLGHLSQQKETVAVAGVGGKTTSSSWLAWLMHEAGLKPSYALGVGKLQNLPAPARWDKGSNLILEADEYVADPQTEVVPKLLFLSPQHAIITSLSFDHPDVYQSANSTSQVFAKFINTLNEKSTLVINGDDVSLVELAKKGRAQVIMVGYGQENDWRIAKREVLGEEQIVHVEGQEAIPPVRLQLPGAHNAWNWLAAAVMAHKLGADWESIVQGGYSFKGVARRWERHQDRINGVMCFDDYAHHPRELERLAETIAECFPNKEVLTVFQPHTYSRTEALRSDFIAALTKFPGRIALYPIFSSARESTAQATVESTDLVAELIKSGVRAENVSSVEEVRALRDALPAGSIFFTVGAGILDRVHDE